MANIILQHEGTTYRTLGYTSRVTSPSLILEGGGQTLYTPLFAVASGDEGRDGNYYYKCCPLAVQKGGTTYRAAYARRYADSFSRTISAIISHSGKTETSTTTQFKTITKSGTVDFTGSGPDGDEHQYATYREFTVNYDVTFTEKPYIETSEHCSLMSHDTSSCVIRVHARVEVGSTGSSGGSTIKEILPWSISITGNAVTTVTTYPDETKSVTASGDFNYGHTYGSAPTLSADNGVSVSNNSGNASFHASKTLTGSVSYNSSKTLSQAFNVSFSGDA